MIQLMPGAVLLPEVAVNEVRIRAEGFLHQPGGRIRLQPVIGIHMHDVFAGGDFQSAPTGVRESAVLLVHHDDIPLRELFHDFGENLHRTVRRSVVHENAFQLRIGLAQDRTGALSDIRLHPVNGHDDGD